ncbi:hypothetical protein EJ08DRAFT_656073 [Tothia fuscella]|uniref:Calcofluor white hypersensitive protein n=1 Tax=Tothia fuscella TaxID=1048955 RepID=A0A9P4P1Q6_9PEZI|nr:hypothetical protein EJ08DRAFT_656073 [Tothia fuscella]
MAGRFTKVAGVGVAAIGGYYLYQAGGSPKVAEKQFEHDAAKLTNKARGGDATGYGKEAKTGAQLSAAEAGKQFDSVAQQAKDATSKVDSKLENYRATAEAKLDATRKEVSKDLTVAVDNFDKNVEKTAAKTKSWLSGWF